jgi:hypothetical protein
MIRFELVQGQVQVQDAVKNKIETARNKMELSTDAEYSYTVRTLDADSWAIINVSGRDLVLRPGSRMRIVSDALKGKVASSNANSFINFTGKIWMKIEQLIGGEEIPDSGNAVAGVRG